MTPLSWNKQVYEVVRQIPRGKVVTYGEIARVLGSRDARRVGWALHANKDPKVPCHRVVNIIGRVAENFAFDGAAEQRRRLMEENVGFVNENQVNISKHLYFFER